ncbi:MAG: sensor histidine kinase [Micromonosporaceae bacterium]
MNDSWWRAYLPDLVIPGSVGVLLVGHLLIGEGSNVSHQPLDYLLLAAAALALLACRRAPAAALVITTVAMIGYTLRLHPGPPAAFPVLAAVYMAARAGHRLLAGLASAGFLAAFLLMDLAAPVAGPDQAPNERTALLLGWFVAANVAGAVSRHRQAYLAQVEQRAVEAERTREETALRHAGEERLRIARELHDSLTHSISIIKLQASVAVHLARKRDEPVPEALLAIQEASGEAMRELRATLDVLRDTDGDRDGLARITALLERSRAAGLAATLAVDGSPRGLPVEVDRAAYRIVQEALTNVGKHAGGAAAEVRLHYLKEALVVRVDNDGATVPAAAPGVGLTGMRERVTALGGRLRAEPRTDGGFTVRAELPLEQRS